MEWRKTLWRDWPRTERTEGARPVEQNEVNRGGRYGAIGQGQNGLKQVEPLDKTKWLENDHVEQFSEEDTVERLVKTEWGGGGQLGTAGQRTEWT